MESEKKFEININDPFNINELMIVTNIKEISYLKQRCNIKSIMKRHLFEREDIMEINLDPQEKVYIPFKFQSFAKLLEKELLMFLFIILMMMISE